MSTKEQYIATAIGCGIGDTLGMPVEGFKRIQIQKYVGKITDFIDPVVVRDQQGNRMTDDEFGKLGYIDEKGIHRYYTEDLEKGELTDDSISYLAGGEAVAERGLDLNYIAEKRLAAYKALVLPDGRVRGGFGQTTIAGLKNLEKGMSPLESGVIGGPGNAPAMMLHYLGQYADATGKYEESLQFAELVGRMTHLDPRSIAGGVVQTHAIYSLLQGVSREEFVNSLVDVCQRHEKPATSEFSWHGWGSLLARLEWIKENKNATEEDAYLKISPSSTAYCSHPFALFMFQKYWDKDPVEGLIATVNYGGDCDTTGAIYGALCGAKNGMIFPERWVRELKGVEKLISLGERLWGLKSEVKNKVVLKS